MPAAVAATPPSVLAISKRVRGATAKRVLLRLRVLLQMGVLIGGGSVVARAGIVWV